MCRVCVGAVQPLVDLFERCAVARGVGSARHTFAQSIAWRPDSELAETFFNSVSRGVFTMVGVDDDLEFRWFGGIALPVVDPGQGEVEPSARGTTASAHRGRAGSYDLRTAGSTLVATPRVARRHRAPPRRDLGVDHAGRESTWWRRSSTATVVPISSDASVTSTGCRR